MALASESGTAAQWSREQYQQAVLVPQPRRLTLVFEEQTTVVAFLIARAVEREWELENIVVADETRRRGIGSRILNEFLDRVRREAAEAVFLEVRESNHAARSFYRKWAFVESGHRSNYYTYPAEDAVVYRLYLP